jgi:hypothetical protein
MPKRDAHSVYSDPARARDANRVVHFSRDSKGAVHKHKLSRMRLFSHSLTDPFGSQRECLRTARRRDSRPPLVSAGLSRRSRVVWTVPPRAPAWRPLRAGLHTAAALFQLPGAAVRGISSRLHASDVSPCAGSARRSRACQTIRRNPVRRWKPPHLGSFDGAVGLAGSQAIALAPPLHQAVLRHVSASSAACGRARRRQLAAGKLTLFGPSGLTTIPPSSQSAPDHRQECARDLLDEHPRERPFCLRVRLSTAWDVRS